MNEEEKQSHDWLQHLAGHQSMAELDLALLQPGDRLRVVSEHSIYDFVILTGHEAMLATDRRDRPSGAVRIMGCCFGQSSTIKPGHLFCGGNLEFTFKGGRMTHTTTMIKGILLWHKNGR